MDTTIPVPKDIMLGLPAPRFDLEILIVLLFLAHIFFVNLMVGSSILTVIYEIAGLTRKEYDKLASEISSTITVNKSLAVVLGVAPLLAINVLYTLYFYSATSLIGTAWYMIVPLVTLAFLFGYLHKYTWKALENQKALHILIGAMQTILFLIIPFIFLAAINLMLFPERWAEVQGWLSTLALPNVFPRYFHFILACIALTGLFFAVYFGRAGYPVEETMPGFTRPGLRRHFYAITFWASLAQFVAGPLVFLTLPDQGISWTLFLIISTGATLAAFALWYLWHEIQAPDDQIGTRLWLIVALLTGTVLLMGYGRHLYRETALEPHMKLVAEQTQTFASLSKVAQWRQEQGLGGMGGGEKLPLGESVFKNVCSACHMFDKRLVGPPLMEVAEMYQGNPDGIITWVKNPGRRRMDYPPMQAIKLTETQHKAVANYILDTVEAMKNPTAAGDVQGATGDVQAATEEVQSAPVEIQGSTVEIPSATTP